MSMNRKYYYRKSNKGLHQYRCKDATYSSPLCFIYIPREYFGGPVSELRYSTHSTRRVGYTSARIQYISSIHSHLNTNQLTRFLTAYRGRDYPQEWPIAPLDVVHLSHEDSVHYSIDTPIGVAEWNATLPSGGALLYLGPDLRPFTLGMFHQLRCLNIIREVIVDFYADDSPEAQIKKPVLARHCMNYLKQTVLCRADMRLESVRAPKGHQMTVSDITHTCRDWTPLYKAAERNYEEFISSANLHQ